MHNQIKQKQDILTNVLKNKNNRIVYYNWLKSELAYSSNAIEGNTLTKKETELVIEEKITSSSKPFVYYQEAVNHANAFDKIIECLEKNTSVDEKFILKLHQILLSGIDDMNAGFYRDCMVRISGSRVIMPNPLKVPVLMSDFVQWLNAQNLYDTQSAIIAHLKFVSIHPFVDGNGRSARLLMNFLLMHAGYSPIIISPRDRKRYLKEIEKAQLTQNYTSYVKYMTNLLNRSMDRIINLLDTSINIEPNEKLLTISQFAKLTGLSVATIRYRIKNNKLKPATYSNGGYMLFKKEQKKEACCPTPD
jgi:Fic family protein